MIDIEKKFLNEIKHILAVNMPQYKAVVYGSRVSGKARKFSDLDIALIDPQKNSPA